MSLKRASLNLVMTVSASPFVDASSITIASQSVKVCALTLSRHSLRYSSWLKCGITIATVGMTVRRHPQIPAPCAESNRDLQRAGQGPRGPTPPAEHQVDPLYPKGP